MKKINPIKLLIIGFLLTFGCNTNYKDDNLHSSQKSTELESTFKISPVLGTLPLYLDKTDLYPKKEILLVDNEKRQIRNVIVAYCKSNFGKSFTDYSKVYKQTVFLTDKEYNFYLILLKFHPTAELNSKLLIQNKATKVFLKEVLDINFWATYDYEDYITPSNLKILTKSSEPDFQKIETSLTTYQIQRIYHNGTYNALSKMTFKIEGELIDTLQNEITPIK